ncbi:MAG TPA: hypothetical protein VJR89_02955 [Polyangiales bacterium]|nr:hypothetical protein [Polyangiales bacterium]
MSVAERFRRAWPTTFGIHVFQTLLAASFALPLVGSVEASDAALSAGAADALAALRLGAALDDDTARRMLLPLVAAGLNYPWLSVTWLRAMSEPGSFVSHARYALGRYRHAAPIGFAALLGVCALAAGAAGTLYGLGQAFAARLDDRTLDLLRLATLLPFAWLACWVVALQDRAYAAISGETSTLRSVLGVALRSVDAGCVAQRGLLVLAQALLGLLAWAAPRLLLGPGARAAAAVLIVTQLVALALSCTRALYLANLARR